MDLFRRRWPQTYPTPTIPVRTGVRMCLITVEQARGQVNLDHNLDDDVLNEKRAEASDIILDYLKVDVSDGSFNWVDNLGEPTENIPGCVVAATKLVLGGMYENRDGDVWRSPQPISQAVIDILMRSRDPAMA